MFCSTLPGWTKRFARSRFPHAGPLPGGEGEEFFVRAMQARCLHHKGLSLTPGFSRGERVKKREMG